MTRSRPAADLLIVSGLILFLELACIRWFPSHVIFLSFFTNTVLLGCFVGMSVGCLAAKRRTNYLRTTPVWLALAVASGLAVEKFSLKLAKYLDVGNQANPDVVFFGTESAAMLQVEFTVPVEVFMGYFFALVALVMVGPGQELGRAFNRLGSRGRAYTLNLLGSLVGILAFAVCSAFQLSPVVWFGVSALGLAYLLLRPTGDHPETVVSATRLGTAVSLALLAAAVGGAVWSSGLVKRGDGRMATRWSPYYRIDYNKPAKQITTNQIGHQAMHKAGGPAVSPYALPHMFQRDVRSADGQQWPAFNRVLIIGAGSGNDVATALMWGGPDLRIDAVEIDPVIQNLGARNHPDKPYSDPRVTVHLNDGRNFLRRAPDAEYDLVIFALVDSLVLQSGYSSLRLESYLFTEESFRDVRRVLKPTGVAAVYNFFRQGWIVARLRETVRGAFGADPVVITNPPRDDVKLEGLDRGFTLVFAGAEPVVGALRDSFRRGGNSYWYPWAVGFDTKVNSRFGADRPGPLPNEPTRAPADLSGQPIPPSWLRLRPAEVEESAGTLPPATDDWPFLYVRKPTVPALTWRGIGLVVALSLGLWWAFRDRNARNPATAAVGVSDDRTAVPDRGLLIRSFFLGTGFMLIETKAVVEMALLFGSTWVVNTVVFAAVLVMALIGNRYAAWAKPRVLWPYYVGLFVAIGLGLAVPTTAFLGWPRALQVVACCGLTFAPVAFAGVIFAASFERSAAANRMFAANVAGALAGGLAENVSVLLGFRWLLLVAGGVYLVSGLFGGQSCALPRQARAYNSGDVQAGRVGRTRVGRLVRRVWAIPTPAAPGFSTPTGD